MHLQLSHICQNSDEAEWLVSMSIVRVEGYVRPSSVFQWLNILYIGFRWMIQNHNLGLMSWWCNHAPAIVPYWSKFRWRRMAISEHGNSGCWMRDMWGRPAIAFQSLMILAFQWLNILYIGPRWMIHHHNLGLEPWWCKHAPAIFPYWSEFRWSRMDSEQGYSACWGICAASNCFPVIEHTL